MILDYGSGRVLLTPDRDWRVGRDGDCDIPLHDERISRQHGIFRHERDDWVYVDSGSSNGSFVRGVRISRVAMRPDTQLRLGSPGSGVVLRAIDVPPSRSLRTPGLVLGVVGMVALAIIAASALARPAIELPTSPAAVSTVPPAATLTLSRAEIVDIGRAATVRVQRGSSSGSGVSLPGDIVLTAAHMVDQQGRIGIYLHERLIGYAELLRRDERRDLALLRLAGLESAGARPLRWGASSDLRQGDEIVAMGFPVDLPISVKVGVVSGLRSEGGTELIQTDASLNPGMSGGPVLNAKGELVGITVFGYTRYAGLNFAVASTTARAFVESPR